MSPVRGTLSVAIALSTAVFLTTCSQRPDRLGQVLQTGVLEVVTRNSPTTYYEGPQGDVGPDYELLAGFADHLGVTLKLQLPQTLRDVLLEVADGSIHLAAAGLTVTEARSRYLRFGPAYNKVTPQVVYRVGERRPRAPEDLIGRDIQVVAGSSHADLLRRLRETYPELSWTEVDDVENEELLYRVTQREVDVTIADSTEVAVNRRFYPELRVGFDLADPVAVAWAFPADGDDSLYAAAVEFLERAEREGLLASVIERYFGNTGNFDYVGTRTFLRHIESRLPRYREWFMDAADQQRMDWRLLAAIGYQESHWNPRAVSPTGVRGLMMLTEATAEHVGVEDRTDPRQSIFGGARYIQQVRAMIPDRIPDPDRTWMALASYNVGYGHLEDARKLTEAAGMDPDRWTDVRENLPKLSQRRWYSQTKHGYARGREPVIYVDNVRSYYDVLLWITSDSNPRYALSDQAEGEEETEAEGTGD